MKLVRFFTCLMATVVCFASYANESNYIFVGQDGSGQSTKTAFILEITDGDLGDRLQINENGEVYLKVDRIIAIPKEALLAFTSNNLAECCTNALEGNEYTMYECPNGHPSRHGDGRCNQPKCPHYRGN